MRNFDSAANKSIEAPGDGSAIKSERDRKVERAREWFGLEERGFQRAGLATCQRHSSRGRGRHRNRNRSWPQDTRRFLRRCSTESLVKREEANPGLTMALQFLPKMTRPVHVIDGRAADVQPLMTESHGPSFRSRFRFRPRPRTLFFANDTLTDDEERAKGEEHETIA